MSYRLPQKADIKRMKHIRDTARQSVIFMDNGTISRISIPTFYKEYHDKMLHDHIGWPSPDNIDNSCQLFPGCDSVGRMINLSEEGYKTIKVSFVNPPQGLTASGSIDVNFVNVEFSAMCNNAITEDLEVKFSIYALGNTPSYPGEVSSQLRDVITKGILHIVAGPIG